MNHRRICQSNPKCVLIDRDPAKTSEILHDSFLNANFISNLSPKTYPRSTFSHSYFHKMNTKQEQHHSLPRKRHNFEIGQTQIAIPPSLSNPVRLQFQPSAFASSHTSTKMMMKHARAEDTSAGLLGSDHSKSKRQRTLSEGSESSSTENRSHHSNTPVNSNVTTKHIGAPNSELSPRMMALISSLEAVDDRQQRQIKQQWPLGPTRVSVQTPPAIPQPSAAALSPAVSALLQQKQHSIGQPLTARPSFHKIEEHPPVQMHARASTQVESRDATSQASVDSEAINTIKRAVAAATATTFENNPSTYSTAVKAALAHHQAAALTAAAKTSPVYAPALGLRSPVLPLAAHSIPTLGAPALKYGISHLGHRTIAAAGLGSSARQVAIHRAVNNDYQKIYKPLQKPPRLPTPHEAMVIAAISTATPAAPVCR